MIDPLTLLGAVAACTQLAGQLYDFGKRFLNKSKDEKALTELHIEAAYYVQSIGRWKAQFEGEANRGCQNVIDILQKVLNEIDRLKNRKVGRKAITMTKIYGPEFQKALSKAIDEFRMQMCLESHRQSEVANRTLKEMVTKMEKLQITSDTMKNFSSTESTIADIGAKIERLSSRISNFKVELDRVNAALHTLPNLSATLIQINENTSTDGRSTRHLIERSTAEVQQVISKIHDQVQKNDCITRIQADMLSQPIVWDDHEDPTRSADKKVLRIWDIMEASSGKPSAHLGGVSLSSVQSDLSIDTIYGKRRAAEEFDQKVQRIKRRRITDLTPYVGLSERNGHFEILCEYLPARFVENLRVTLSDDLLRRIAEMVPKLTQEYRCALLDRILTTHINTLPKLTSFEALERAMIVYETGKIESRFCFAVSHQVGETHYFSRLILHVSGSELSPLGLSGYHDSLPILAETFRSKIQAMGLQVLRRIMQISLSVLDGSCPPEEESLSLSNDLFGSQAAQASPINCDTVVGVRVGDYGSYVITDLGGRGAANWEYIEVDVPTIQIRLRGECIFHDYTEATVTALVNLGLLDQARQVLEEAVRKDRNNIERWFALGEFLQDAGEDESSVAAFNSCLEVCRTKTELTGYDVCSLEISRIQYHLVVLYSRLGRPHEVIRLAAQVPTKSFWRPSETLLSLKDAYASVGDLESAVEVAKNLLAYHQSFWVIGQSAWQHIIEMYSFIGEEDQMLAWLDRTVENEENRKKRCQMVDQLRALGRPDLAMRVANIPPPSSWSSVFDAECREPRRTARLLDWVPLVARPYSPLNWPPSGRFLVQPFTRCHGVPRKDHIVAVRTVEGKIILVASDEFDKKQLD